MIFAQCSECQSGENFKKTRANGSHVGLKPVLLFVTQPKLRIMCLSRSSSDVTAINVVPFLTDMLCVCGKVLCMCGRFHDFCGLCTVRKCRYVCVECVCLFVLRVEHACGCGADIGVGK